MRTLTVRRPLLALVLLTLASPVLAGTHADAPPLEFHRVPDAGPSVGAVPALPMGRRPVPKPGGGLRAVPPSHAPRPEPARPVVAIPSPHLVVVVRGLPASGGHAVSGIASFYCTPAHPICHHSYPPGSMVAAACGKLRRAIGSDWRGRRVTVRSGSRSVSVVLADWCGSADKTIDLYGRPFSMLGSLSRGVLPVVVEW